MTVVSTSKIITLLTIVFCLLTTSSYTQIITPKGSRTGYFINNDGTYIGYQFYPDHFYALIARGGDLGNSKTFGSYTLTHDTIIATPFPRNLQKDYFLYRTDTLIIRNDTCLFNTAERKNYCLWRLYRDMEK